MIPLIVGVVLVFAILAASVALFLAFPTMLALGAMGHIFNVEQLFVSFGEAFILVFCVNLIGSLLGGVTGRR